MLNVNPRREPWVGRKRKRAPEARRQTPDRQTLKSAIISLVPETRGTLIIVCGLPASGKTTHAKQLEATLHAVRLSPDEWMDALSLNLWDEPRRAKIEALQWQFAQQLLPLGVTVIIEWGTWGRSERDALRLRARELGAAVELHYLSASVDVLYERVQRRGQEDPPIKRDQLVQWAGTFQTPTPDELALFDKGLTLQA